MINRKPPYGRVSDGFRRGGSLDSSLSIYIYNMYYISLSIYIYIYIYI